MTLPRYDRIGFLIPGNYTEDDPFAGLETTLRLIVEGEALGYDDAWVRQRHLERGISSGATFLAAASQRTKAIERPARVKADFRVDLPYPRHRGDPHLAELRRESLALLGLADSW